MMPRRAFTLFEVLVAVGMIGLLAGALAVFVTDLATTRSFVTRTTDQARSADALFGTLEQALQTAVLDGGARGAGVSGTDASLRVLSSRADAIGGDAAAITRAAFAPLVATEVRLHDGTVMIGRAGTATLLPAPVSAVAFRYFDGDTWSDAFDSLQAGQLPVLVEVSVWFARAGGPAEHATRGPADRTRRIAVPDARAFDGGDAGALTDRDEGSTARTAEAHP